MAKIKGLPELRRKLERLKRETAPQVKIAMEAAAETITATMRSLVPVDYGDLRDSIGWTWGAAPRGSISMSQAIGGLTLTIFAGDEKAFYARWIEFGTAPHINEGKFRGSRNPGITAQPFFYPAYRAHKKQAVLGMRKAIRLAVKLAVQG